jgi:hypothetical protein
MTEPPDQKRAPPVPRWVKVFGLIFVLLIVLVAALHLGGGGLHHDMP